MFLQQKILVYGEYSTIIKKNKVFPEYTLLHLLSLEQQHHNASIQLSISDCKVYPCKLSSVQDQTSIVSKHNTETDSHLQIVKYTL